MPHKTENIESLAGLIEVVIALGSTLGNGSILWFRGEECDSYSLCPKILRYKKSFVEIEEREKRLFTRFRQQATPYARDLKMDSEWEILFSMQHYGLPTRLLDWTVNLLVATYFAVKEPAHGGAMHDHEGDCVPRVWCIDPNKWNNNTTVMKNTENTAGILTTSDDELKKYGVAPISERRSTDPLAIHGAMNSPRIVAQQGSFMIWGNSTRALTDLDVPDDTLWEFRLAGDRRAYYRDLLVLGFHETSAYPDLATFGKVLLESEGWS